MNRTDNQTRKVFQRMNKAGSSVAAIAIAIGKTKQTVHTPLPLTIPSSRVE